VTEKTTATHPGGRTVEWGAGTGATTEFELLYRANVDAVTAYFARRAAEPQVVADLTADTFVAAITSFGSFDPKKGTGRAWVFGIAWRACRDMVAGLAELPERDRAVIELVDITGLRPQEAAALGLAPGTVRMRLLRARLRKEAQRQRDAAQTGNDNSRIRGDAND
jgi:DNA-directed RNA polymerase specialized sigma24 family protein